MYVLNNLELGKGWASKNTPIWSFKFMGDSLIPCSNQSCFNLKNQPLLNFPGVS